MLGPASLSTFGVQPSGMLILRLESSSVFRSSSTAVINATRTLHSRPSASVEISVLMIKTEILEAMLYGCVMWSPNADRFNNLHT